MRNATWRLALRSVRRNFLNNIAQLCLHKRSVKIMRLQLERTVRECKEPGGLHVNHAILILEWPFDQQKFATRDQQAVAVVKIRRDDDIGDASFVFQGKEDEAFGCARALASNDAASGAHEVSVLSGAQFFGGQDVAATQF